MKTAVRFNDKININSELIRKAILSTLSKYNKCIFTQNLICEWFYQTVFKTVHVKSLYSSDEAFFEKSSVNLTDDHYLAPRLLVRALIENERDIIFDKKEFLNIFLLCCETVRITKKQNNYVRYRHLNGEILISELTIHKYDKYATWWDEYDDEYDEFPLKGKVPKFFTKYEKSKLKKY